MHCTDPEHLHLQTLNMTHSKVCQMLRPNLYTVQERGHNIIQNDVCQPSQLLGNWIESTSPPARGLLSYRVSGLSYRASALSYRASLTPPCSRPAQLPGICSKLPGVFDPPFCRGLLSYQGLRSVTGHLDPLCSRPASYRASRLSYKASRPPLCSRPARYRASALSYRASQPPLLEGCMSYRGSGLSYRASRPPPLLEACSVTGYLG